MSIILPPEPAAQLPDKPRLLELCACEGGATTGYQRAGFHVTAVDLDKNRLKYNPADEIVHGDALAFIKAEGHHFDAVHISPNCQWYTRGRAAHRGQPTKWERSIPTFRDAALATGLPYVIENVADAGWDMREPIALCGCMFDLSVRDYSCTAQTPEQRLSHVATGACDRGYGVVVHLQRLRLFETNWGLTAPGPCDHSDHEWVAGAYGGARRDKYEAKYVRKGGYVPPDKDVVKALLGIEHDMTWNGLFECIPPAYAEYVGKALMAWITAPEECRNYLTCTASGHVGTSEGWFHIVRETTGGAA